MTKINLGKPKSNFWAGDPETAGISDKFLLKAEKLGDPPLGPAAGCLNGPELKLLVFESRVPDSSEFTRLIDLARARFARPSQSPEVSNVPQLNPYDVTQLGYHAA